MSGPAPESTLKTLGFAAGVAFTCALLVSVTVHWLQPVQQAVASLDQTRAVLEAARMLEDPGALSEREIIDRFLAFERRVVDLESAEFSTAVNPATWDYRDDLAEGPGRRPRYMQIFLLHREGQLVLLVLPFYGAGMWSNLHGYLALEADLATVAGVTIHEHGETPGIGDRVQAPEWLDQWRGKRLYDRDGRYRFRIVSRPAPDAAEFSVDSITGATITVDGVDRGIADWFGEAGYGPFLARLRARQR